MFLYNEETGGKGFIQISDSEGGLKNSNSGTVTIHKDAGQSGVFGTMSMVVPLVLHQKFHTRDGVMLHLSGSQEQLNYLLMENKMLQL